MVSRKTEKLSSFKVPGVEVYPPKALSYDMITVKCADIHPDSLTPAKAVTHIQIHQTDTNQPFGTEVDQGQGPGAPAHL